VTTLCGTARLRTHAIEDDAPVVTVKVPTGHAVQVADEFAPTAVENALAAQGVHSRYSATVENDPAGHAAHVAEGESFVMYCPDAQVNGNIARSL
jgi:hypothetical protein